MKAIFSAFICIAMLACQEPRGRTKTPESVNPQKKYLFFLHNRFLEEHDLDAKHPEYGRVEYAEILQAFRSDGFIVISEKRPKNTDPKTYAQKVKSQIDSLLAIGVNPSDITVSGTSKGGYIAQYSSTLVANPRINYVFIGGFTDADITEMPEINFCGNILTIYDKGDSLGVSAEARRKTSKLPIRHFKEIELDTGLRHGFLYKAMPEWIEPVKRWANRQY